MARGTYYIVSETTEDRFDETESLEEALRIARDLVKESQSGDPVLIEHNGRVIHQLVLTPEGQVEEAPVR
jgi:hypothetical protein